MGAGGRDGVKMERGVESPSHPSGMHPIHRAYTLLMPTSFSALQPILHSASSHSPSPSALSSVHDHWWLLTAHVHSSFSL